MRTLAMPAMLAVLLVLAPEARGEEDLQPELLAERDALIDKIIHGESFEASVRRFAELVRQRDQLIATSRAARERAESERRDRAAWQEAYRKTADYEVSWACILSVDPANPPERAPFSADSYADWGRIVRKETVRLAPDNPLADGTVLTMYEVAGVRGRYDFSAEEVNRRAKVPFVADKGDLVLVCGGPGNPDEKLPPEWRKTDLGAGFAARIAELPRIVKKGKWDPVHILPNYLFFAIQDVKWSLSPEAHVLMSVNVLKDLGGGRYEAEAIHHTWVLEVPPGLPGRELLVPGRSAWVVMGKPRFDAGLKKLVLVAEDIEERYVLEPRSPKTREGAR